MKIISPQVHAVLDFATVVFLIVAPKLFLLSDVATTFSYVLAGIHLLMTICTNSNGGFFKVIPFRIHGLIEFFVSVGLAIAAYTYFRNNNLDRIYFTALSVVILLVFILTDYKKAIK